jgi:hypothetical protein
MVDPCAGISTWEAGHRVRLPAFPNACLRRGGARCHTFAPCAKQRNLRETEEADVVLAAYDSLFTGLSMPAGKAALIVIDEGCWERAIRRTRIGLAEITAADCSRRAETGRSRGGGSRLDRSLPPPDAGE